MNLSEGYNRIVFDKGMSLKIWVDHNPITRGSVQTVHFSVSDNETNMPIQGARILDIQYIVHSCIGWQ
jgi:hypothetical protein